jgi:Phage integrase family
MFRARISAPTCPPDPRHTVSRVSMRQPTSFPALRVFRCVAVCQTNGKPPPKTMRCCRAVDIERGLVEILKQHLGERKAGRVFQTRTGTAFSKDNVRRKLQSILTTLGLPKGGLHTSRHGRVLILQESGVPDDLVREWLGHSSLRTTSRYTHFRHDCRRQVAMELGRLSSGTRDTELRVGPKTESFAVHGNAA